MVPSLLAMLVSILSGGAAGALGAAVTRTLYVPVLVPVALGAVLGAALGFAVYLLRVRRRPAVTLATLTGWLACIGAFHYGEYRWTFRPSVVEALDLANADAGLMTPDQVDAAVSELLQESAGRGDFLGFLRLRATSGLRVRATGTGDLGTPFAAAVWGLDVLLVLAVALRIALGVAGRIPGVPSQLSAEARPGYTSPPPESVGKGAE